MNNISNFTQDILIIGFGAQAKAWALNLRDSKREITIGLRKDSSSKELVSKLGFKTIELKSSIISKFNFIINLTPDDQHEKVLKVLQKNLAPNQIIIYAHGFSVSYGHLNTLYPKQNHVLLAPKAIASEVRYNYECQSPLVAVVSYEFLKDLELKESIETLARNLGITVGPIASSFKEETNADLFSEQSILCSLIPYGAKYSFEKLVQQGISPEVAYIECWHEVKLIADAMLKFGPTEFFKLISPNALLGGELARERIFSSKLLKVYDELYEEIESGKFFQTTKDCDFQKLQRDVLKEWSHHPLQQQYDSIGKKLRPC